MKQIDFRVRMEKVVTPASCAERDAYRAVRSGIYYVVHRAISDPIRIPLCWNHVGQRRLG